MKSIITLLALALTQSSFAQIKSHKEANEIPNVLLVSQDEVHLKSQCPTGIEKQKRLNIFWKRSYEGFLSKYGIGQISIPLSSKIIHDPDAQLQCQQNSHRTDAGKPELRLYNPHSIQSHHDTLTDNSTIEELNRFFGETNVLELKGGEASQAFRVLPRTKVINEHYDNFTSRKITLSTDDKVVCIHLEGSSCIGSYEATQCFFPLDPKAVTRSFDLDRQ